VSALVNPHLFGAAAPVDPFFANVVLLLHCDGANAATSLIDSSAAAHTVTCAGNHKLTTAQAKFGTASLDVTATGSGYAESADSADWEFGAGQFTVEAFFRPTIAISGVRIIAGHWTTGSFGWDFGWNGATFVFFYSTTGSDNPSVGATYTPTQNAWVHVAADRDASNVLRIYADGVVKASGTVASAIFNSTASLRIGNDGVATRAPTGQVDEVRITKGVARYGGAFTPPSAPFPDS
jgi:uncharacterized protein (DUF2141 family)